MPGEIKVPCPECGDLVAIKLITETIGLEDGTLSIKITPDVGLMAEHYATEHCGEDVIEP